MSANAVSGTSLRQDLVSALRQARAASAPQVDASAFTTASDGAGAAQSTSSSSQVTGSSAAPALSSDLMASLLQLQSDFNQMGLQTGVTSGADPDDASGTTSTSGLTDASQSANGAAPVHHHHHGHHARPSGASTDDAQSGQSATVTGTSSDSTSVTGSSRSEIGDGLQSLLQQVTKAIAAYATTGPVGIAAAALTSSKA